MVELLREADMVLNSCGRLVPPAGYRYIDLPRVMNFFLFPATGAATPYQQRISNDADTVFICKGVGIGVGTPPIRIRWPDGRFLSQFPFQGGNDSPGGIGANLLALPQERAIDPGGRVSVEFSGSLGGVTKVALWGVLRYMLKETGAGDSTAGSECLVGYSTALASLGGTKTMAADAGKLLMMPDPAKALAALPRLKCGPNQNIMAPEFLLGNQCTPETPVGFEDETFTFFSQPINVPANGQNYGNAVIVPGSDRVVIKSIAAFVTINSPLVSTIPTLAIRLPNGYSLMGGDMLPMNLMPGGGPSFPTLRVNSGDRLILDMADMEASGNTGSSTTIIQFDGVKRRKKAA